MRRFLRILFNAMTVLSLVLAILVAGLWVRSYIRPDAIQRLSGTFGGQLRTMRGELAYRWLRSAPTTDDGKEGAASMWFRTDADPPFRMYDVIVNYHGFSLLGFGYVQQAPNSSNVKSWEDVKSWGIVTVPLPCLLVVLSLLPAWRLIHRTVIARRGPGLCPACNYDLRASPDRCPECGAARTT